SLLTVRRRWRTEVMLRACGRTSAVIAALLLAGTSVGVWLQPGDAAQTLLAIVLAAGALAVVAATAWRIGRAPGHRQVARYIEERVAQHQELAPFDDVLVTA